jgi:hypothetical protein
MKPISLLKIFASVTIAFAAARVPLAQAREADCQEVLNTVSGGGCMQDFGYNANALTKKFGYSCGGTSLYMTYTLYRGTWYCNAAVMEYVAPVVEGLSSGRLSLDKSTLGEFEIDTGADGLMPSE